MLPDNFIYVPKTHLALGTYWSKSLNKVNVPGRSFSFLLVRTKDPMNVQRILLRFTIMTIVFKSYPYIFPGNRLVIFELSFHCFFGLTQHKACSSVAGSWLGRCHCNLAGVKHLYFRFYLPQDCILSYFWLTAPKASVRQIPSRCY